MLSLDLTNTHQPPFPTQTLNQALSSLKTKNVGFYQLDSIQKQLASIQAWAKKTKKQANHLVICGVGGSALGPICLQQALAPKKSQRLTVLENIDPDFLQLSLEKLELSRTHFLIISKSGTTPETMAQWLWIRNQITQKKLSLSQHVTVITDEGENLLSQVAMEDSLTLFTLPTNIGGRFSVQTTVGLLPAAFLEIDLHSFFQGFKQGVQDFLNTNSSQNQAWKLAQTQFTAYQNGQNQHVILPYHSHLRQFGAWATQLIAESTGKINSNGQRIGITPIPSLGVTDQHSQVQLWIEGPVDKLVIFIKVNTFNHSLEIPTSPHYAQLDCLHGRSFTQLLHAEQTATTQSLTESDCPNLTIELEKLDPQTLAQLFMLFQGATAFLGELMEINAFDQPGVERGKFLTREILAKKG